MTPRNSNHRCKGREKNGKPCRAAATAGGLCFFHANPDKASELGRIGGRTDRHAAGENADPLPTLDNAIAVRDMLARLIADVYAGKIHPRIAAVLAPLLNLQLRAITMTEIANIERRFTELEKRLTGAEDPSEATASPLETSVAGVIEEVRRKANEEWDNSQASAGLSKSANPGSDDRKAK
jgi:hypothetical protein